MDKEVQNKLTDAARKALNESVQEIANIIIERANQKACSNNMPGKEISLRDIMEAKKEILSHNEYSYRNTLYKKRRLVFMTVMTGFLYTIFGLILYIYQNYTYDITKDLGLIMVACGIIVIATAFFYFQMLMPKNLIPIFKLQKLTPLECDIIEKWRIIETLGTKLMIKNGASDSKAKSVNFIVEFLSKELGDTISSDRLKKLLIARNEIVHKGLSLSNTEIIEIQEIADEIIKELNTKINS